MRNCFRFAILLFLSLGVFFSHQARGQTEVAPWGNIMGVRHHGELFEFETSINVISADGLHTTLTGKEQQRPHYSRVGNSQVITTNIDSLFISETVQDHWLGSTTVGIQLNARKDTVYRAVYFHISLPDKDYGAGKLHLHNAYADSLNTVGPVTLTATAIDLVSTKRKWQIHFQKAMPVIIKNDTAKHNLEIYIQLATGAMHKGDSLQYSFWVDANGDADRSPVNIAVNTAKQGNPFDGLGGNFRLQNPRTDPQVIDYSLKNLRVAWGRVEMPWRFWQRQEDAHPADSVQHPAVVKAMEMAQRLQKIGMPIILSAWSPPSWAIIGKPNFSPVNGVWGNPLNAEKLPAIYKSITDYILYLKAHYGVNIALFSFNESDIGINIRLTADEHNAFIKGLGAYFAAHGVATKMLLGDNSDATSYKFIYPALNDPAALPYIGAISFHSWRGWTNQILSKWAEAAAQIKKPLIVGEGSIDAQAWGYPQIFQEPTYALQEINLYTRLLNICQPISILQWQLTADYSPLIGGGIFGNTEPLHPGQRFRNLKQLASTPAHLFAMPINCDAANISCAALGDTAKGIFAIHLVNNGPTRKVTLSGLPANLKTVRLFVTNKKSSMKEKHAASVTGGNIVFKMKATSYYTVEASGY